MTDNEIIKALECCLEFAYCFECPYECSDACAKENATDIINLINRQKAEIEMLEGEIDKQYEQARADILGNMSDGGTSCHWCIAQHRADAIKEFAELLKEKRGLYGEIWDEDIDNIVKVLVGDNDGKNIIG